MLSCKEWPRAFLWGRALTVVSILALKVVFQTATACRLVKADDALAQNVTWLTFEGDQCILDCHSTRIGFNLLSLVWAIISSIVLLLMGCQTALYQWGRGKLYDRYVTAESHAVTAHVLLLLAFSFYYRGEIYMQCDDWSPYAAVMIFFSLGAAASGLSLVFYLNALALDEALTKRTPLHPMDP
jgi:hypothetical protein